MSLNKNYSRKLSILRERKYPDMTDDDAGKQAFRDMLDKEVPDVELNT